MNAIRPVSSTERSATPVASAPAVRRRARPEAPVADASRPALAAAVMNQPLPQPAATVDLAIGMAEAGDNARAVLDAHCQAWATAVITKNDAARDEKAAKADLHAAMTQMGVTSHRFQATVGDMSFPVNAAIELGTKDVVDMAALRALCDDETFLRIVTATKTAIERELGKNAVVKCVTTLTTEPDLSITRKK